MWFLALRIKKMPNPILWDSPYQSILQYLHTTLVFRKQRKLVQMKILQAGKPRHSDSQFS
jgi:hypothetical protein